MLQKGNGMSLNKSESRSLALLVLKAGAPRGFLVDLDPLNITFGEHEFATVLTARASQTDTPQVSISGAAIERAREASVDADEVALAYFWIEADGSLALVVLSLAQHEALASTKVGGFSTTERGGEMFRYCRRTEGAGDFAVFQDLASKKKILFATRFEISTS